MKKSVVLSVVIVMLLTVVPARAEDYVLPDLDGKMQPLRQYPGKWVVVNYWATWCGTCRQELGDLIALHEANKDGDIVVVGINFESISPQQLRAFVEAQGIPYPILRSPPIPVTPLGNVPALPTTYIIDPSGKAVAGEVGLVTQRDLEAYISKQKLHKGPGKQDGTSDR